MQYSKVRPKSFLQSFMFVGAALLSLGLVFLIAAAVVQLIPIDPNSVNLYINGIRQPPTQETVRTFRLLFLLIFGIFAVAAAGAGGALIGRAALKRRGAESLKENGTCLTATVVAFSPSRVSVNHGRLQRLVCSYTDFRGQTYIFKSDLLRNDPVPFLPNGEVKVYHDREDMRMYFVDVDGSIGIGTRVMEL